MLCCFFLKTQINASCGGGDSDPSTCPLLSLQLDNRIERERHRIQPAAFRRSGSTNMQYQHTQSNSEELSQLSNSTCIICAEFFSDTERIPTTIQCGHTGVCSICFLRLRMITRDFNCPQCKQPCENVVCTVATTKKFEDFEAWGEQLPGFYYDHMSRMFFPPDHHRQAVEPLKKALCPVCNVVKRDVKNLRLHIINEHKLQMCQLCIDFKHSFPSEQKIYTQQEYEVHLKRGDGDGDEGHPNCEFCKKRYYDKNALFQHLQRDHFECHICVRHGIQYKYYNKYESLEDHFRDEHFLCEEPSCLEKRYVVFSNEIDYSSHMVHFHPQKASRHKSINIQFQSHRQRQRNLDSSAEDTTMDTYNLTDRFDGGVSGKIRNGVWQIELPESARDPREGNRSATGRDAAFVEAGGYSQFSGINSAAAAEDFPSLAPSSSQLGISGGSSGLGPESFPSLGGITAPIIPANWGGGFKTDKRLGRRGNSGNNRNNVSHTMPQGPGRVNANASGTFRTATAGISWQSRVDAVNLNYGNAASLGARSSSTADSTGNDSIYSALGGLKGVSVGDQYAAFAQYQPAYQQQGVSSPARFSSPVEVNDPLTTNVGDSTHLKSNVTSSMGLSSGTNIVSIVDNDFAPSRPPLDLGRNIEINYKESKKQAQKSEPKPPEPAKEPSLNNMAYRPPPKRKEAVKQQQINNINSLSNMLSSMGMGPKKPNMKAKQSGITGAIAGSTMSGGNNGANSTSEVGNMLRNLHSDLKNSSCPPPPGFVPPPPPGFVPSSSTQDSNQLSDTIKPGGDAADSTSNEGQNKKPTNWTKIGGVTHTIEPVDLVVRTGPVSFTDYPSLPPTSSNDDSSWSSVSKRSNNGGKSFASAASKQGTSVNPNTSISISANLSKDVKTNNDAKAKKGIKNQKKVRQDLMSLMTGK